jgi:hypothetical protein
MRHGNTIIRAALVLAMMTVLALAGCAAREAREAKADRETEVLLVSSGFNMKMADTPAKLAHLKTLPQRTIFKHKKDGRLLYFYADAGVCKCLCYGDKTDYKRFGNLAWNHEQSVDAAKMEAVSMDENVFIDTDLWGPWD